MTTFINQLKDIYLEGVPREPEHIKDILFKDIKPPLVIGTSLGEVYRDKESICRMIASDLDGWGDLLINPEASFSYQGKSFCYAVHKASLSKTFDVTEQTYEGFLEEMTMIAQSGVAPDRQAMDALYLLTHLLHDRPEGPRRYSLPLDLITASDRQGHPVLLAYSMTTDPERYDVRRGSDAHIDRMALKDLERWSALSDGHSLPADVKDALRASIREIHAGADVTVGSERFLVMEDDGEMVFAGFLAFKETIDHDKRISKAFKTCETDLGTPPKKRLFDLQKSLVRLMRDKLMGEESETIVRCFGMASLENGTWNLKRADFQYPHEMILENKNDLETAL